MQINLSNNGPSNMNIYWATPDGQELDYDGQLSPVQVVAAGQAAKLSAYRGYAFVIVDDNDRCHGIIESAEPDSRFVFGDINIEVTKLQSDAPAQLTPLQIAKGCAEHGQIASENTDREAEMRITNEGSNNLYVYWVNFEGLDTGHNGSSNPVQTVAPGCTINFTAFRRHVFSVLDEQGQCVGIFKAREGRNSIVLGEGQGGGECINEPDHSSQAPPAEITPKRVFATSNRFTGDLGGIEGADAICNYHAQEAGLGGQYKAWISDGSTSPAQSFNKHPVPYVRTDGVQVSANFDGLLDAGIDVAIDRNEFGQKLEQAWGAWTGTKEDGTSDVDHCENWTRSEGSVGVHGCSSTNAFQWTGCGVNHCHSEYMLFCVEQ